jgi:hypothetical protein
MNNTSVFLLLIFFGFGAFASNAINEEINLKENNGENSPHSIGVDPRNENVMQPMILQQSGVKNNGGGFAWNIFSGESGVPTGR